MCPSDADNADPEFAPRPLDALSVLYHPHFEPPLPILRRALLVTNAVRSIVPAKAQFTPSMQLFKHMEAMPDTFIPTSPIEDDINIVKEYWALGALREAFAQLSKDAAVKKLKGSFTSPSTDELSIDAEDLNIDGVTLLSAFKVSYSVYVELQRHGLIFAKTDDGNFLVDERAANLIVSFLAQRMSYRLAVRTLTGIEDSYLLSSACDVLDAFMPDKNALFASSVLRIHIPENIEEMDHRSYAELRARYSDLRQSFPLYLAQLQQLYKIDDSSSAETVSAALKDIEARLQSDVEAIKTTAVASAVRKWVPLGIGSALSVGAAFFMPYAVPITFGATVFQAISTHEQRKLRGVFDGVRSMVMDVNYDISRATRLPNFLSSSFLEHTA